VIKFYIDTYTGTPLGTATTDSGGLAQASLDISGLSPGHHTLYAVFDGDSYNSPSRYYDVFSVLP